MAVPEQDPKLPPPADPEEIRRRQAFIAALFVSVGLLALTVTCLTVLGLGTPDPDANLYPYPNTQEAPNYVLSVSDWFSGIPKLLGFFSFILGFALAGSFIIMLPFTWPTYALLKRTRMLQARWILPASWLAGFLAASIAIPAIQLATPYSRAPEPAEMLQMSSIFGVYTLVGGLVFCRMTIWRRSRAASGD